MCIHGGILLGAQHLRYSQSNGGKTGIPSTCYVYLSGVSGARVLLPDSHGLQQPPDLITTVVKSGPRAYTSVRYVDQQLFDQANHGDEQNQNEPRPPFFQRKDKHVRARDAILSGVHFSGALAFVFKIKVTTQRSENERHTPDFSQFCNNR